MLVTDAGMFNEPVKPLQPLKAQLPMDVTDSGMINVPVKPLQPEKAQLPMDFTDSGNINISKLSLNDKSINSISLGL